MRSLAPLSILWKPVQGAKSQIWQRRCLRDSS